MSLLFILSASLCQAQINNGTNIDELDKVVGGDNASDGEFPWMASLVMSDGSQGCGASLIHPQWILTAGHCIIDFMGAPTVDKVIINSVTVDLNNLGGSAELIPVDQIVVHPDYTGMTSGYGPDLALIRLDQASSAPYVSLASTSDASSYSGSMPAKVLGWGKTQTGGNMVDSLLMADCFFIAHNTCATQYSASMNSPSMFDLNPSGNICAGFYTNNTPAGAAQGDSGGPLFYTEVSGQDVQVGIVSGGDSDITTDNFPGVFTLIPKYKDWIDSVIAHHDSPLKIETETVSDLSIRYTNDNQISIVDMDESANYTIQIYNLVGRLMDEIQVIKGTSAYDMEIISYDTGLYIVQVHNLINRSTQVKKITVNR